MRFVRENVGTALAADHILAARARGVGPIALAYRHALPNVYVPLLTLIGLSLPGLLGGSLILEVIFSWPGLGRLMFDAVMQRDYPVVMALTTLSAVVVLAGTLVVDVLCVLVDPRVRVQAV